MPAHNVSSVLRMIEKNEIMFVDLRFTDIVGQEHHFTIPARQVSETLFTEGRLFDGSSFKGWKLTENSDMILLPDADSAFIDPFLTHSTLVLNCDILEPDTMDFYHRDPRSLARRAEAYLTSTKIADTAYFGPENEFFLFDSVHYSNTPNHVGYRLQSKNSYWNSNNCDDGLGHFAQKQGGYTPLPPVDKMQDLRSEISASLEKCGIEVEIHHQEVASAGQSEIGVAFNTLLRKADEVQRLKYVIKNCAHRYQKSATFMPKPYYGESGSGMHVHMSLFTEGENQFTGQEYGGLSQMALYFIGGIIQHARALNAFTNASTNSYKRLIPNYEAPVLLAYSAKNRTASIRIPFISDPKARRVEARFPDSTANPYLAFSALLMAGIDGIENRIDPGPAFDKNLYDLTDDELLSIPKVCRSLSEALEALDHDRDFLRKGAVFTDEIIDAYIETKRAEIRRVEEIPHPVEYELYYSI